MEHSSAMKNWNSIISADDEELGERECQPEMCLGLMPYDSYHSITKKILRDPSFQILTLPPCDFRLKLTLTCSKSMISSPTYQLSLKHNSKPILTCCKQLFGKYIFYSKDQTQQPIQKIYMSKYQNQYKLYLKEHNDKYQLAYFTHGSQPDKSSKDDKIRILLPMNQHLSTRLQGIKSNVKKQSEIKWRWQSKSERIEAFNVHRIQGNLLKLMYVYVSKGDTVNDTRMVMREVGHHTWEFFVKNPLTVIHGFALAVLMADNCFA